MTFEKKNTLSFNQLSKPSQYRMIEIEIASSVKILTHFTMNESQSAQIIVNLMLPFAFHSEELRDEFKKALLSYEFKPKHNEITHYFRYQNLGVHKIRQYITVPLKDLVQGGKYDTIPNLTPIFQKWEQIQHVIPTWNTVKHKLNLFDDKVIQKPFIPKEYDTPSHQTEQPIPEPASKPKTKSRIIEYFNATAGTAPDYIMETTRKDFEESIFIRQAIADGTPYALVTRYDWEE